MPSVGVHLVVLDEVVAKLEVSNDPSNHDLADILTANNEFAALGAVGPDLLYYLGFDKGIIAALVDVYNGLNTIAGSLNDAADIAANAGLPNIAELVHQFANTTQAVFQTIEASLTSSIVILNNSIVGSLLTPSPRQQDKTEKDWNWGDIAHWRLSGAFARDLASIANKSGNPQWKSYALGYKTHIATDFVGHPYVNQCAGGPGRSWVMRHHLAESFMDAYVFKNRGVDINTSKLHKRMEGLKGTKEFADLADMVSKLLQNSVDNSKATPFELPSPAPSPDQLDDALGNMLSLFRFVTEDIYLAPPQRPGISIPPLPGQYGSISGSLGSLLPSMGGNWTLTDLLKALLYALLIMPAILADLAKAAADLAAGILTYPARALLYLIQLALYRLYRFIRYFLVIAGVAFPYIDELDSPLGRQFTILREINDGTNGYPHTIPNMNFWRELWETEGLSFVINGTDYSYINYPSRFKLEQPTTLPSPYPKGIDPEYFINQAKLDPSFLTQWTVAKDPNELRRLVLNTMHSPGQPPGVAGFGNAVDLSIYYFGHGELFDHIDLDADRGYGFYKWTCDGGIFVGDLKNVRFI